MRRRGRRRRASAITKLLLIADTHLGADQADRLLVKIADALGSVDGCVPTFNTR